LSYLANRQTNKVWQKHHLLGGGNKMLKILLIRHQKESQT